MPTTRRSFLQLTAAGLPLALSPCGIMGGETTQLSPKGYFTIDRRDERWWLIDPHGKRFFTLGLNHIDPATLRYPENNHIWREKYGNSMQRWLQESVAPDLKRWAFNSVGWTQEVITRGPTNHRHSRPFTYEEYQWLDMPYCHLLPFADFHQWEMETKHPDFFSDEFADWCDHVAREHCVPMANDPKLIGYFYIDCPTWVHVRKGNEWKGPLFDPAKLKTETGRNELTALATQYYRVTHDAIRRYDSHHLILGDRYEINAPLPVEVVQAASPFVDVLSFQQFRPPAQIRIDFEHWRQLIDMPILLADGAGSRARPDGSRGQDALRYRKTLEVLRDNPACIGFHLCGAYLTNRVRNRGLRTENDMPDQEAISVIAEANRITAAWVRQFD